MAKAENGNTVKVHYTGKLADGTKFDTSEGRDPLEFKLGEQKVIPGFEAAILGMDVGEKKTIEIPAAEAYGDPHPEMEMEVKRSDLPPDVDPQVGQQYQVMGPNNQPAVVAVKAVSEDSVTLDANHPLAGKDLTFDLELVEVA
jgi:peptidylprolyl isomerase